jgi:hypothetical protein
VHDNLWGQKRSDFLLDKGGFGMTTMTTFALYSLALTALLLSVALPDTMLSVVWLASALATTFAVVHR